MEIELIYTSITPELIAVVEKEIAKQLGQEVETVNFQDSSILADILRSKKMKPDSPDEVRTMLKVCSSGNKQLILTK